MAISLRINEDDKMLFKRYAKMKGITLSELIRQSVIEKIEDEYDLEIYKNALEEYEKTPISYSHDEVCKMLGID
jgi:RHH-type rel operon transcriptional repressor/antitoxin RelB